MVFPPLDVGTVDIDEVAKDWDELADRLDASPFVRPGWVRAWARAFASGPVRVVTAREHGGRLVGLLALERRLGVFRSPVNSHSPEAPLLASRTGAAEALLGHVLAGRPAAVAVGPLDIRDASLDEVRNALRTSAYATVEHVVARPPFISGRGGIDDYRRTVSPNLRHDVERRLRRLMEEGGVAVAISDGSHGLSTLLEEGFLVERQSWKGASGTAIASDPATRGFYSDVARWAAGRGWLRLAFLRLDGRPIAFQLDLEAGRSYRSLKIGYDPSFARFSPGKVLTYSMVCRAMARGHASYELLGTNEPWKDRWADGLRELVVAYGFVSGPRGALARSALRARGAVKRVRTHLASPETRR